MNYERSYIPTKRLFVINYSSDINNLSENQLRGFFVGWPNPPTKETLLKLLQNSYKVVVAFDDNKVVGFITAISDGVLSAYIPLFEVLPKYQKRGIGKELVKMMRDKLSHLYMIDLLCDPELIPYYEKQGMAKGAGAMIRNYKNQSGCL